MIQIRCIFLIAAVTTLAAVAPAQAQHKITYVVVNNLFSTPAYVAAENGYWANQGLDVAVKLTSSGRAVVQAVQAGDAQFGHAALSTTIASARASGNLLKGVIAYYNAADYIAKAGGRAIIGRKDRGIEAGNPKSMEGKKIAHLTGSTNEVYLREWFRKNNLDISKSQLVSVPVENMPITIAQGLVDAIAPWEPYQSQAIRELGPNAVVVSRGAEGLVADTIGAVAQEDWIKKNYDFIEKFATGIAEATLFVRKNPKESAEIATRFLDGLNVADGTEGLKWLDWDPRVSICTLAGLVSTGNEMIKTGLIKKDKPFEATDFYDDTVFKRIVDKHPELYADLPPLPKTLAQCKGQLG
jgi:NitT/TauT family transport system substrate-binding protein/sulfonate transport system substrate-binding protein